MSWQKVTSFVVCNLVSNAVWATPLHVAGFNIESNGSKAPVIAEDMNENPEIDIWGLSESTTKFGKELHGYLPAKMATIMGTTGSQRLQIEYNSERFELKQDPIELHYINTKGCAEAQNSSNCRVRSPLVALFADKISGKQFYFMVNHLYRKRNGFRHQQATWINEWVAEQSYPVIAVGDYNFDMDPKSRKQTEYPYAPIKRDLGFDNILANDVFAWAEPEHLAPSQCSSYHSLLDFIFVSGSAKQWLTGAKLLKEDDFCDYEDNTNSDHRPMKGSFEL